MDFAFLPLAFVLELVEFLFRPQLAGVEVDELKTAMQQCSSHKRALDTRSLVRLLARVVPALGGKAPTPGDGT